MTVKVTSLFGGHGGGAGSAGSIADYYTKYVEKIRELKREQIAKRGLDGQNVEGPSVDVDGPVGTAEHAIESAGDASSVSSVATVEGPVSGVRGVGLEGYYGVKPGQWFGSGAERLGLEGNVDRDDLASVLSGVAPSGERMGRAFSYHTASGHFGEALAPLTVLLLASLFVRKSTAPLSFCRNAIARILSISAENWTVPKGFTCWRTIQEQA